MSLDRILELLDSPDLPAAINEAAAVVDRFDTLKDEAASNEEWEALHDEQEAWEDALAIFERQHRDSFGLDQNFGDGLGYLLPNAPSAEAGRSDHLSAGTTRRRRGCP
jgi:hypothetical protein